MRQPAPPTTRRRLIAALAIVMLTGVAVAFVPAPSPVAAAGGCPVPVDRNGNCPIEHTVPIPGTTRPHQPGPTQPHDPSNPSTGTPDDGYYCEFHVYPDQEHWRTVFPEAPPGSVFGEYHCFQDGRAIYGPYVPRFVAPDEALGAAPLPPPTPEEVAADAMVSVRALLKKPTVATNPPDPAPSTIAIPTFVSVPNWQGPITPPPHCLRGVCVDLQAVPELTFDPGEPGAATIPCEDGGTVFDRNGPEPREQARGACAYAYKLRTGVDGRPDAWPAEVTVTWTVTWTVPGDSDTLDPISLSTTFDRVVEENRSVVVDYSD
jgi:hypothetical protein